MSASAQICGVRIAFERSAGRVVSGSRPGAISTVFHAQPPAEYIAGVRHMCTSVIYVVDGMRFSKFGKLTVPPLLHNPQRMIGGPDNASLLAIVVGVLGDDIAHHRIRVM